MFFQRTRNPLCSVPRICNDASTRDSATLSARADRDRDRDDDRANSSPVRVRGSKGTEMKLRCKISTVHCLSTATPDVDTATNRSTRTREGAIVSYLGIRRTVSGEIDAVRVKGCPSVNT